MGAACCKCTPSWKNEEDVIAAYVYEECTCFRPRKYVLRSVDEGSEWALPAAEGARKIVEREVFDPNGLPVSIAEDPKGCCGYQMFEVSAEKLNSDWAPKMNSNLEVYGYEVDAFQWVEYRYVSEGQSGGHTQPVPHLCIRVKKLVVTDAQRSEEPNTQDK